MKKKAFSRFEPYLLIVLAGALMIALNIFFSKLTGLLGLRLDLTSNQLYTLSQQTADVLERMEEPVAIRVISPESDFLPLVAEVLKQYQQNGGEKVEVEYVDPYTDPTLVDAYIQKGYQVELGSVIVEGASYAKVLKLEDMFQLSSDGSTVESLRCEQQITGAILYAVGTGSRSAQFTAGHNEHISDGFIGLFSNNNYDVSNVALSMSDLSEDADLVVIAAPSGDFSQEEIAKLDRFLERGGRLMVFVEPSVNDLPNLEEFLLEWGIGLTDIVVAEPAQYTDSNPLSVVPIYSGHTINQYFSGNQLYLVMPSARALEQKFVSRAGIRTQKVLYSTDRAYDAEGRQDEKGPFTLAMTAEKEQNGIQTRIFTAGSRGLYSDALISVDHYGNAKFLAQAVNWCMETDSVIDIPEKRLEQAPISITAGQATLLAVVLAGVLPFVVLAIGFSVYHRRRHR